MSSYKKTERLLYNYNKFKKSIEYENEYINFIQENGLQEKSKNFVGIKIIIENKDRAEILEDLIKEATKRIIFTQKCIDFIDLALKNIEDDEYYELIKLKYFDRKSMEYIAEYFDTSVQTVYKHKTRLLKSLHSFLFAEDVLKALFEGNENNV